MPNRYNALRYRIVAGLFALSLLGSLVIGLYGPRLLGLHDKPLWMLYSHTALGVVSVLTVPMAWRWLYRRERG